MVAGAFTGHLLALGLKPVGTGDESGDSVFEGPIWDNLPAVQNNHVYREESCGFVFSDPISLEAQLKFVVDSLTKTE